jgi:predicted nucleic acid-binding protein
MNLVVDSNIAVSAILNPRGKIGKLFLLTNEGFHFFAPNLLKIEVQRHKFKLIQISKLSESDFDIVREQIYGQIRFISEEQIPFSFWKNAIPIVRDIDMDDIAFVALTEYLDAKLWTGDKKLLAGIKERGYLNALTTDEIEHISR